MEQATLIDVPPYAGNDDEDVRYTLPPAEQWLRGKAMVSRWDLDPAASNESHLAERYYTLERSEDGLSLPWANRTVINPPWSLIDPWIERAFEMMLSGTGPADLIAFLLPLRTHRPWWQRRIEPFRDMPVNAVGGPRGFFIRVHHPPERFRYGAPGNPRGLGVPEPNFQSVGVIFRRCT